MHPMEATATLRWFCLRTQPKRERLAAVNLREQAGVDAFFPRIRRDAPRRGLAGTLAEALFPGYLFARFTYAHEFRRVLATRGVAGVVSFGGPPPAVPDDVIAFLRAQVREAGRLGPAPVFAAGSWVRIAAGCFRELEGRVLHFDSRTERVRLLLTLLGRDLQISVPARQLASRDVPACYPSGLLAASPPARASAP